MNLSAVVLTKNEENNLKKCLSSLSFCDEIIIVDNFSTDKTLDIARKHKAKIFIRKFDDFSRQRNFGLSKSRGEWILFVDADEVVSKDLAKEILKIINLKKKNEAYYIKRRDYFWGRELHFGEVKNVRNNGLIRLVRRSSGKWQSPVHETFVTNSSTRKLEGYLNHYPHQSLKEFLNDINFYSTLRAGELFKQKKAVSWPEIIFLPVGKFLLNYIFKLGFLDGVPGFVYAFLMSFHSFLVRAKLYQYQKLN